MSTYSFLSLSAPANGVGAPSARGINNAGQMVGFYLDSNSQAHGFLYSGGVYTALDDPLASHGAPYGGTYVYGINNLGQIVGSYADGTGTHGFLYSGGTYTTLDDPLATSGTSAYGINDRGQIVGSYGSHGFLYDLNTGLYTTLDDPSATSGTRAYGINNLGQIAGTYLGDNTSGIGFGPHGFLYNLNDRSYSTINNPNNPNQTYLYGINDAGQMVGFFSAVGGSRQFGFVDNGDVFTTISDLTELWSINNSGTLTGSLYQQTFDATSGQQAFYATLGPNPSPPAATTAIMILRGATGSAVAGQYEIYDAGNNSILDAYQLAQVGADWQSAGLADFNGDGSNDMLLRNSNTGGFEVYDISNNNVINASFMGAVGSNWQVMGFGNFSSNPGETDMLMRDGNTGQFLVYQIANNTVTNAYSLGAVGVDWRFGGLGNFSSRGETDMILQNVSTGALEVYDISNTNVTNAAFMGAIGSNWQVMAFGNFSSRPGETDMLVRSKDAQGALGVYDIANNQIIAVYSLGAVGSDWQYAGIGPMHGPGASDVVFRNVNTNPFNPDVGAFEVYDIGNNKITGVARLGAANLDWQPAGFAADPLSGAMGGSDATFDSASQLVQAMAGFGGNPGVGDGLNAGFANADVSQQTFLTMPQHA